MKAYTKTLLLATAATITAALATHAASLVNGSFETGTFPDNERDRGFTLLAPGLSEIEGWTVSSSFLIWIATPNIYPVTPFDGSFCLDLGGIGIGGFGGVYQSITTVIGQQYRLSFQLGTQQRLAGDQGPISVLAGAGATTLPFTFIPSGPETQWGGFDLDFTAINTSTSIHIIGDSTVGRRYIFLDRVSVDTVPEPSSAVLLFLGAAICLRRRSPNTHERNA